jgi:hypothetical protein
VIASTESGMPQRCPFDEPPTGPQRVAGPSRRMGKVPRRLRTHAADRGRLRRRNSFRSLDSPARHHLRRNTNEYPVIITADGVQAASIISASRSAGNPDAPAPPTGSHRFPTHAICRCSTDRCPVRSFAAAVSGADTQSRRHDHDHHASTSINPPATDYDSSAADHDSSAAADHDSSAADPNLIATTTGGYLTAHPPSRGLDNLAGRLGHAGSEFASLPPNERAISRGCTATSASS